MSLILASASPARQMLLTQASIPFRAIAADIDEDAYKKAGTLSIVEQEDIVHALACAKAEKISKQYPESLVLGSDQILIFEGKLYSKPRSLPELKQRLLMFAGREHDLLVAAVFYRQGELVASYVSRVSLHMWSFSEAFLEGYLARGGDDLLQPISGYFIEGEGLQLFDQIIGDYHAILGLPLMDLLPFLRAEGIIPA